MAPEYSTSVVAGELRRTAYADFGDGSDTPLLGFWFTCDLAPSFLLGGASRHATRDRDWVEWNLKNETLRKLQLIYVNS